MRAEHLGELVRLIAGGELSGKLAKEDLPEDVRHRATPPAVIVEREGLKQISDTGALEKIIDDVIAANPKAGGAIPRRQDDGDRIPGRPGDEGHRAARRIPPR